MYCSLLGDTHKPVIFPKNLLLRSIPVAASRHDHFPSGKRLHNYGKSPLSMGKSTLNHHFSIAMWNYQRVTEILSLPTRCSQMQRNAKPTNQPAPDYPGIFWGSLVADLQSTCAGHATPNDPWVKLDKQWYVTKHLFYIALRCMTYIHACMQT